MSTRPFRGYPEYLEVAAVELGLPETVAAARRIAALAALANLCAQAIHAEPTQVDGILAQAERFRDQLRAAARAAELILGDVRGLLGLSPEEEATVAPSPAAATARNRSVGSSNSRSRSHR